MKLKLSGKEAYQRKQRIFRLFIEWQKTVIRAFYPNTGGSSHLMHNWYRCSKNPALSDWIESSTWARYRRLETLMDARDTQREHQSHGKHFRPMWCPLCNPKLSAQLA